MLKTVLTTSRKGRGFVIGAKSRIGRIRRAVLRGFIVSDGKPITVRAVLERAYPRQRRFRSRQYDLARCALRRVAVIIARQRFGRGRAALWAPIVCNMTRHENPSD